MTLLIFIALLVYVVAWEFCRTKEYPFDVMSFINVTFAATYVMTPIIFITLPDIAGNYDFVRTNRVDPTTVLVLALVAHLSIQCGWLAARRRVNILWPKGRNPFSDRRTRMLSCVGLGISGVAFFIYISAFGGLVPAVALGALRRYNPEVREAMELGASATAIHFVDIANIIGLYAFYRVFLKKDSRHRRFYLVAFLGAFVLGVLGAVVVASRGALLMLVFSFYFVAAISEKRFYALRLTVLILLGLTFGLVGKAMYADMSAALLEDESDREYFSGGVETVGYRILARVAKEGAHGVISIGPGLAASGGYTWMSQFVDWPLNLVPTKLIGGGFRKPVRIYETNSNLLGVPGQGVPPGLIASFLYGAGVAGMVVGMFLYGFVGRVFQHSISKWLSTYPGSVALIVPLMLPYGLFVGSGDPSVFIKSAFGVIAAAGAMLVMARVRAFPPSPAALGSTLRER